MTEAKVFFEKKDAAQFEKAFAETLKRLEAAEKLSKNEIKDVSRSILSVFHSTQQIGFLNRLLQVLSPANRAMMVKYLLHFTGYFYNTTTAAFEKKNAKRYDDACKAAHEFLEDVVNNVWSWTAVQNAHEKPEAKPLDLADVKSTMEKYLKKAAKSNLKQVDVLRAAFSAGFTLECLLELLAENTPKEELKKEPTPETKETIKKTTTKGAKKAGPPVKA